MAEEQWPNQYFRQRVIPEWTDYNGHLNVAYYALIFDRATDHMLDYLQLGRRYADTEKCSTFAVEAHVRYMAEVSSGEEVTIHSSLLDVDAKRIRYGHKMRRSSDDTLVATLEQVSIHVDLVERRVMPWTPSTLSGLVAAAKPADGFEMLSLAQSKGVTS